MELIAPLQKISFWLKMHINKYVIDHPKPNYNGKKYVLPLPTVY